MGHAEVAALVLALALASLLLAIVAELQGEGRDVLAWAGIALAAAFAISLVAP